MERRLDGGLVLRSAAQDDAEAIVAFGVQWHGQNQESGIRQFLTDPSIGPSRFTVVTDGDRLVSSLCLMTESLRMGDVDLPAGQVEYVATHPDYRGQGLVRTQFEEVHRWSADRGDLLTMVAGIPYYYRRFGYEYALGWPDLYVFGWQIRPPMPDGWTVRRAEPDDVAALARLHERAQAGADLVRLRTPHRWGFLVTQDRSDEQQVWVAEQGGGVRAAVRVLHEDARYWLIEPAADELDGGRALVAAAVERLPAGSVAISDRPGTPVSALIAELAVRQGSSWATYVRLSDPISFLDRIRPVLSARLAASPFRHESGELVISLYAAGIALDFEAGEVTGVRLVDGVQDPGFDGVGVPPDLVATLLLGRHGARELSRRHDDVLLGKKSGLMEALFPRLRTDIL